MAGNFNALNLVADVGGTNTRVGFAKGAALDPDSVQRFTNAEFGSLRDVLERYTARQQIEKCNGACVAVAGPVQDGIGALTNLDWQIDATVLSAATGASTTAILNDLQAQGFGLPYIAPDKLGEVLLGDVAKPDAVRLVIGIGTGFNIAPVYPSPSGPIVGAAEAGHIALPVANAEDLKLSQHLTKKHGFADVEEALSGRGLKNIYGWLTKKDVPPVAGKELVAAFEAGDDPRAKDMARIFARLMGNVAGDLALIHLPYGGIYLSGGVARALGPHLSKLGFGEAFKNKGRFSDLMRTFSVNVIEDDFAALQGCASYLASHSNP